jgi:glutathione transport system substrate-binding protein
MKGKTYYTPIKEKSSFSRKHHLFLFGVSLLILISILVTSCAGSQTATVLPQATSEPTAAQVEPTKMEVPTEVVVEPTDTIVPTEAPSISGGTLKFGLSTEPPGLDPAINTGTAATTVKLAVYRGLVVYNKGGEITYELAESLDQPDDVTYIFHLRPNAYFHNGDPVTAEDVKFTFDRILDPDVGASLYTQFQVIDSIDVLDDKTVQFKLKQPNAPFMDYLALHEASIVSKKYVEAGNDLTTNMMGAGPFIFNRWEKGVKIVVDRNPNYYKEGLPKLDQIEFITFRDEDLRVTALKTGDIDIIEFVPWKDMPSIEADPNLTLQTTGGPFMYLVFNTAVPPFDNAEVRRALGYAIDRQAILDAAFVGRGSPLYGLPIPKESLAYDEELVNFWEYDPDKAKQMLADAGFPNGFSAKLLSTNTYAMHEQTAVIVEDSLKKIGLDIQLDLSEWGVRVERGNSGDYEFGVMGTGAEIIDPDFLTAFFCLEKFDYRRSLNWKNEEVCNLLDEARSTLDTSRRKELYKQLGLIALQESPYVFLTWREQGYAFQNYVEGFENLPGWLTFYSGAVLEGVSLNK